MLLPSLVSCRYAAVDMLLAAPQGALPESTALAALAQQPGAAPTTSAALLAACQGQGPFAAAAGGTLQAAQLLAAEADDPAALQMLQAIAMHSKVGQPAARAPLQQQAAAGSAAGPSTLSRALRDAVLGQAAAAAAVDAAAQQHLHRLLLLSAAMGMAKQGNALGSCQLLAAAWQVCSSTMQDSELSLASAAASLALNALCSQALAARQGRSSSAKASSAAAAASALQAAQQLLTLPGLCPSPATCSQLLQLSAQQGSTAVPQLIMDAVRAGSLPGQPSAEPAADLLAQYIRHLLEAATGAELAAEATPAATQPAAAAGETAGKAAAAAVAPSSSTQQASLEDLFSVSVAALASSLGLSSSMPALRAALSSCVEAGNIDLAITVLKALRPQADATAGKRSKSAVAAAAAAAAQAAVDAAAVYGELAAECLALGDVPDMQKLLRHVAEHYKPTTAGESSQQLSV
jgi:hypothetical protein